MIVAPAGKAGTVTGNVVAGPGLFKFVPNDKVTLTEVAKGSIETGSVVAPAQMLKLLTETEGAAGIYVSTVTNKEVVLDQQLLAVSKADT